MKNTIHISPTPQNNICVQAIGKFGKIATLTITPDEARTFAEKLNEEAARADRKKELKNGVERVTR